MIATELIKDKIAKLKKEVAYLNEMERTTQSLPDKQVSLTDPDSRTMATSGRGTGIVGYNVQSAVDENHIIAAHEVTNVGSDRSQLANMAEQAQEVLGVESLSVVADRGYYNGAEIRACDKLGITTYVPKTMTSSNQAKGLYGKQDFIYRPEDAGACQWRNESACSGLQSQTGDANYGRTATDRGDEGITPLCLHF